MKKLIFFFALCFCLSGKASQPNYEVIEHPNSKDSLFVVKTVDGVTSTISIFIGNRPIIKSIVDSPEFASGLTALILAIWRFFEKRKLRRKGLLKDRVKASNEELEGKEHFEETVNTWQNTDLYKIWLKIGGGGATFKNDYGDPKEGIRTASQIGNATGGADFNNGHVTPQTLRTVEADDSLLNELLALINQKLQYNIPEVGVESVTQISYETSQYVKKGLLDLAIINQDPYLLQIRDLLNSVLKESITGGQISTADILQNHLPTLTTISNLLTLIEAKTNPKNSDIQIFQPTTGTLAVYLDSYNTWRLANPNAKVIRHNYQSINVATTQGIVEYIV